MELCYLHRKLSTPGRLDSLFLPLSKIEEVQRVAYSSRTELTTVLVDKFVVFLCLFWTAEIIQFMFSTKAHQQWSIRSLLLPNCFWCIVKIIATRWSSELSIMNNHFIVSTRSKHHLFLLYFPYIWKDIFSRKKVTTLKLFTWLR